MATAWSGHAVPASMPTQSRGHGTRNGPVAVWFGMSKSCHCRVAAKGEQKKEGDPLRVGRPELRTCVTSGHVGRLGETT